MLFRSFACSLVLVAVASMTISGTSAQDGKYPDWSGQWRRTEGGPPRYDMSKPPGLAQQAPLTPEYQALFEASLADQAAGGQGFDREICAFRPGCRGRCPACFRSSSWCSRARPTSCSR